MLGQITVTFTYQIDPTQYQPGWTKQEMIKADVVELMGKNHDQLASAVEDSLKIEKIVHAEYSGRMVTKQEEEKYNTIDEKRILG